MTNPSICVIIPTYNNAICLDTVIDAVLKQTTAIIVVNDGSTDLTCDVLARYPQIETVSYEKNFGKGYALRRGFDRAVAMGYDYAITMDSDGQHSANDLPLFEAAIEKSPDAMLVGCRNLRQDGMPSKNTFANHFSNIWFALQTGCRLPDTQSGFRLYPLLKLKGMRPLTKRYEAELELLVRIAWKGIPLRIIPISVCYPEERITHFRPMRDFLRISLLNTVLCAVAICYGYPSRLIHFLTELFIKRKQ